MKPLAKNPSVYLKVTGLLALTILLSSSAWAQLRVVGAVSGTVLDPSGAVVANAKVVLKDTKTGVKKETSSNSDGAFLFPDLATGVYEITVTAPSFQTARLTDITVSTSQTTDLRVSMTLGQASETVTVTASDAATLETSSQLMTSTITTKMINQLPLGDRSGALGLARLAPGAMPPSGGDSRFNNLAGGAVNVTVDGINNASNGFKSGGTVFFATVPVRLGALEEVTVESGGLSADSGAQSGANIKFTTKRGGKQYHGSVFYEPRSEQFNANSWTRNAQGQDRLYTRFHDFGGNFGGPLIPFGGLKEKLFFFANFERQFRPSFNVRTVSIPTPAAQQGIYTYVENVIVNGVPTPTNVVRTANVLNLAAARGLRTTLDPVSQAIINFNNQVPKFARQVADNDLNRDNYTWDATDNFYAYFPATRLDYYVTPKQQLTFTWNYFHTWEPGVKRLPIPDVNPTAPFRRGWYIWSSALQSTLSSRTFNEFRYGIQHSGDTNARAEYGEYYKFDDKPLRIGGTLPFNVTVPFIDQANITGRHFITTIQDTLTLSRGRHTVTTGGSFRKTVWNDIGIVFQFPTYGTGTPANDPLQAAQAFTGGSGGTLPGINTNELGNVEALYNLLTGRVASSNFTRVVNPETLKYDGVQTQNFTWTRSNMGGVFAQDRFRVTPSLTLNYGLRWEIQGPMHDGKGIAAVPDLAAMFGPSKRLFAPGEISGDTNPTMKVGFVPYRTDWKNFAPNFGIAWNPNRTEGFLGKLFGGSKTVIRASWSMIVYDEGTQFFANNPGTNVGKTINATTLRPGQSGATNLPAFYTLSDAVANPLTASSFAFTASTDYAKVVNLADQTFSGRVISGFDPTLRAPYTDNYTLSIQRELWKNTVLEVAYVGTQSHLSWRTVNLNEVNIFENGFLNEFKNAQRNLAIFRAANPTCAQTNPPTCTFANTGLPGQVALPIFEAAFGQRGSLAAVLPGNGFRSTGFINNLDNGAAGGLAQTLATGQDYVCRMFGNTFSPCRRVLSAANAPGPYPINFFLLNPFVSGRMNYVDDTGWSNYNGLQVQFRQRLSHGLSWNTNYTWSKSMTNLARDTAIQDLDFLTLRDIGMNKRVSPFDIRHVIQTYGTYDLPLGRGRWLQVNNRYLNAVVGDWTLGSVFIFQTGAPIQLSGGFDTVNALSNNPSRNGVNLAPGVTLDQIQDMFNAELTRLTGRPAGTTTDLQRLGVDPRLIGPDFRANPQFLSPNRTPGEFGATLFLRDRNVYTWNVSMTKAFKIMEKGRLELFASFNNVLNHPRWSFDAIAGNPPGAPPPTLNTFSTAFGVINAPTGNRSINLRATLSF
jgi:Carboxypeptidase regulatory-like domain